MLKNIQKLGSEILEINLGNGWNVTTKNSWAEQYKIPSVIALIHSEATEMYQAYQNGDTENFLEEAADVAIRVLDCMAGMEIIPDEEDVEWIAEYAEENNSYDEVFLNRSVAKEADIVMAMHTTCSFALESFRKDKLTLFTNNLLLLISLAGFAADLYEADLEAEIKKKCKKNRSRGYRHGGKKV